MLNYTHLEGRAYIPGSVHCYQLVRDLYRDNFGIELRNYAIPTDWNGGPLKLIDWAWEREGFYKVADWQSRGLQPGDLLAMSIRTKTPNHLGVYMGEDVVFHHPYGQPAKAERMRNFWRMVTCYVLRHPDVPNLTQAQPNISIKELASGRYAVEA